MSRSGLRHVPCHGDTPAQLFPGNHGIALQSRRRATRPGPHGERAMPRSDHGPVTQPVRGGLDQAAGSIDLRLCATHD